MAWARGERRVCSMVRAPSPEDEDRRRLTRERGTLLKERIQHTNRVRGLLSGQGVRDYNPLRRDRFERLEARRTGDGRELPPLLKAEIRRELDRIAVVTTQLAAVAFALIRTDAEERNNPAALLLKLKGLGCEFASLLWLVVVSQLRQPTPGGGLRRIGAQSLAERRRRTGPGHLAVGQSPPAQDHDRACLVLVASPAGLGVEPLVSRRGSAQRRDGSSPQSSTGCEVMAGSKSGLHGKGGLTLQIPTPRSMHNAEMMSLTRNTPC